MRLSVLGHVVASLRHCCVAEVSNQNPVCYATLSEGEWPRGRSILSRLPTNRSTSSSMKEVRDPWARERMLVKLMVRTVKVARPLTLVVAELRQHGGHWPRCER